MRSDSIGLFWQDIPEKRGRGSRSRVMPPIPETGWRPPSYYPNLSAARALSVDLETYDPDLGDDFGPGWARGHGHICGFSVGTDDGCRWYFPIRHEVEPQDNLDPDHSLAWLRDTLLSNPHREIVGANLLYDYGWLAQIGIWLPNPLIDVQFAEALLDDRARVALEILAQKYLKEGKTTDLLKKWILDYYSPAKDKWRSEIYRAPPRLVGPYGETDADLPIRIYPYQHQALNAQGLLATFRMECDLIPLLVAMRFAGVHTDRRKAEQVRDDLLKRGAEAHKKLDAYAGFHVEINSPEGVAQAFDKFQLTYPRTKPTKGKPNGRPSFRKDWLKTVDHPLALQIMEIRRLEKLRRTFIEGYILEGSVNDKIYCSFHPLRSDEGGTIVGRFSSSHPNLQNIPIRDKELGKLIRSMFVPDPGHRRWCKLDYSQIQFRELVHYAVGDPRIPRSVEGIEEARRRYINDPETDYHDMVKAIVEEATGREWDRRPIKNLNFGKMFGMGDEKAGASTGLEGEELKHLLSAYDKGIPFAKTTLRHYMKLAERQGYLQTIFGRRQRFDLWEPAEYGTERPALPYRDALLQYGRIRRAYLHKALPRLFQGTEGDVIKAAILRLWKEGVFNYTGVPRILVHDETDFSDPGAPDDVWSYVRHVMETTTRLCVPILVEFDHGPDWGNAEHG